LNSAATRLQVGPWICERIPARHKYSIRIQSGIGLKLGSSSGSKNQQKTALFLSAVTIGELRKGLVILPRSRRRTDLETWLNTDVLIWFQGRILPVTHSIADRWGVLDGQCQLKGTPLGTADGLIAATALEHELILVTRNISDFAGLGVEVFNPWDAA